MTQLKHAEYRPRLVDDLVDDFLSTFGAVQIDGPKYCGKTWTAEAHAGSAIHLDRGEARRLVEADPQVAIVGEQPRLIDEWQEIPSLRDAVRGTVDETGNLKEGLRAWLHNAAPQVRMSRVRVAGERDGPLSIDGELRQDSRTSRMIFDLPTLVSWVSQAMTLEPGDLLLTGTPEGVGPLADGQLLELEIEGLERLSVRIAAER